MGENKGQKENVGGDGEEQNEASVAKSDDVTNDHRR